MDIHENQTIRKYAWMGVVDYCLDCQYFIASKHPEHQKHIVVNIKEEKRDGHVS